MLANSESKSEQIQFQQMEALTAMGHCGYIGHTGIMIDIVGAYLSLTSARLDRLLQINGLSVEISKCTSPRMHRTRVGLTSTDGFKFQASCSTRSELNVLQPWAESLPGPVTTKSVELDFGTKECDCFLQAISSLVSNVIIIQ